MVDVEADYIALRIEIDHETLDDFARLRPRRLVQFDIEALDFRVIVQFHGSSSRKFRSSMLRLVLCGKRLLDVLPPVQQAHDFGVSSMTR